ncbi:Uncharacterised protein [Mycobacterium tuberculosis]|nr:Uncharacterised protein [Mycobacterium tuberculosis]
MYTCAAFGSKRVTISISPRRRQVVISTKSKPGMAASASRSVSAREDSGRPKIRMVSCR